MEPAGRRKAPANGRNPGLTISRRPRITPSGARMRATRWLHPGYTLLSSIVIGGRESGNIEANDPEPRLTL
jgi:hypothetical protein